MKTQTIRPRGPLDAVVTLPGSKSITNRALLLAALCEGRTVLEGALDSEDTQVMFSALKQLGLNVSHDPEQARMIVEGLNNWSLDGNELIEIYVGNSGTTIRFLAAILCFSNGNYRLHGKPRMHQRPIRDLVDALRQLGANIRCENNDDCPPLLIEQKISPQETETSVPVLSSTTVAGNVSSQYLSALLMSAPLAAERKSGQGEVEIRLSGDLVSRPYIELTLCIMKSFGIESEISNDFSCFRFSGTTSGQTKYVSPKTYRIEPDASAASYFFAAAAVCGGSVTVSGLSKNSLQGDVHFVDSLEKMGCAVYYGQNSITVFRDPGKAIQGVALDMNSISDTAQTLAVVALFAEGSTEIKGIEHVRFKETDRIGDLAAELRKFGADVEERQDGLKITPPKNLIPTEVETYDDHRMAMSFAVAGLRLPGVVILDPDCCQKTFPRFFDVLNELK